MARNMARTIFYVDYDEDPAIGGQQGVFRLNQGGSGHTHGAEELIGAKIVGVETDKEGRIVFTVEK